MVKLIEVLLQEADNVRDIEVENMDKTLFEEAEPDENVIGEVPPDLRKLFFLGRRYKRKAEEFGTAAKFGLAEKAISDNKKTKLASETKSKLLKDIFWTSLREAFNLWDDKTSALEIKRGWKVVVSTEDDECQCMLCTLFRQMDSQITRN